VIFQQGGLLTLKGKGGFFAFGSASQLLAQATCIYVDYEAMRERGNERGNVSLLDTAKPPGGEAYDLDWF
jgi:hypothetical protein